MEDLLVVRRFALHTRIKKCRLVKELKWVALKGIWTKVNVDGCSLGNPRRSRMEDLIRDYSGGADWGGDKLLSGSVGCHSGAVLNSPLADYKSTLVSSHAPPCLAKGSQDCEESIH
ncbi:hypothetical protein NE237_000192 [Protea cynaroides]|uniref:Uncharacterized protein n=1 Tax=Protea cynaroides TaxID=273540 RepID=A0A9Q0KQY9_9MAGN|nr:hypothetical protein NE237_000192 [Protea cynaroides]